MDNLYVKINSETNEIKDVLILKLYYGLNHIIVYHLKTGCGVDCIDKRRIK